MLLIISKNLKNRVLYIFRVMFEEYLGISVEFTTVAEEFERHSGPKLAYGIHIENELYFAASGLLFETDISMKQLHCFEFEGDKAFFPVYDKQSTWPFDPFSASFYLISRYEEYLPHFRDNHERFKGEDSDSFKNGFLFRPLINIWSLKIRDLILVRYPSLIHREPKFRFLPTVDIDAAFAFRHKGPTRLTGGLLKALWNRNYREFTKRLLVLLNLEDDPFDTFDFHLSMQRKYGFDTIFFILMADYDKFDKNIPVSNRHFQQLIKHLADYGEVGIHPSYASNANNLLLSVEISRLSKILGRDITMSRQHFLRLEFPVTYRNLINKDIVEDYTMGYHDKPGYRAGICTPFLFYDLDLDMETNFRIHPFVIMDGTLNNYLKLSPLQAKHTIEQFVMTTKEAGGEFISIWHNSSLSNTEEWEGWAVVYEDLIRLGSTL